MTDVPTTYFSEGRLLWRGKIAVNGGSPELVEFDLSETDWDLADAESVATPIRKAVMDALATQDGKADNRGELPNTMSID